MKKILKIIGKGFLLLLIFFLGNITGTIISGIAYPMDELQFEVHNVPTEIFYNDGRM